MKPNKKFIRKKKQEPGETITGSSGTLSSGQNFEDKYLNPIPRLEFNAWKEPVIPDEIKISERRFKHLDSLNNITNDIAKVAELSVRERLKKIQEEVEITRERAGRELYSRFFKEAVEERKKKEEVRNSVPTGRGLYEQIREVVSEEYSKIGADSSSSTMTRSTTRGIPKPGINGEYVTAGAQMFTWGYKEPKTDEKTEAIIRARNAAEKALMDHKNYADFVYRYNIRNPPSYDDIEEITLDETNNIVFTLKPEASRENDSEPINY